MKNCNCHYEMPRDGSSQLDRFLKALDPAYAPIDGHSQEDLLVFAKGYAAQIRFYDSPESKINDGIPPEHISWQEFFRRDMAVIAASISVVDTAKIKRDYDRDRASLETQPSANALKTLFDLIISLAAQIDGWYSIAIPENPLYADLVLAINSTLRDQVKKIVAYEEAYTPIDPKNPLNLDFSAIKNTSLWGLDQTVDPDASIYQGAMLDDKIRYAALYVDDIFHTFFSFINDLVEVKSLGYMLFALESYPSHQPHMALFITFLELFRLAQTQMNELTGRMLDFYYQDVLKLAPKPSIADRVHLVFELAKDVADYDLAQGTALKAGKDASGKEQMYATETDLVINQAKVKELKTVFIQKTDTTSTTGTINAIYARPVANSQDGFGAPFTDPSGKWPTFGKGAPMLHKAKNICQKIDQYKEFLSRKDQAQIGFAIASPQLLLQGGNRLIVWTIPGLGNLLPAPEAIAKPAYDLEIWLSGENGWVKINNLLTDTKSYLENIETTGVFDPSLSAVSGYYIDQDKSKLYIFLPIVEDGILPFNAKLHTGYAYETSYPVVQLMLGSNRGIDYYLFNTLTLLSQSLSVRVGSINQPPATSGSDTYYFDGLKTLVLQNDNGLLDANKPFDPYTLYPDAGKSFYIGSDEVFNKPLGMLAIDIKKTLNTNSIDPQEYAVSVLAKRSWLSLVSLAATTGFTRAQLTENILNQLNASAVTHELTKPLPLYREPITAVSTYQAQTLKGFIRLDNLIPVDAALDNYLQASQALAPKLQIKEISVSYYSELSSLDPSIDQFFHVYPFGVTEIFINQDPAKSLGEALLNTSVTSESTLTLNFPQPSLYSILNQAKDNLLVDAQDKLLPGFSYLSPDDFYQTAFTNPTDIVSGPDVSRTVADNEEAESIMDLLVFESSGLRQIILGGNNQYSGKLQEEGILYIGLENLQPLDTLSLLFQFAEGSAVDEDNDPPAINWSYLSYNQWRPLPGNNLTSDGTYGFQTTGIVKIDVPEDSTDHNTIITDGLRWFCASVTQNSERIPMLVNVVAQAVEAQFQDNGNDQSHFDNALPAGSIAKLAVAVAQIGKVAQPFASFDGKHQEIGKEFYTRVSERLRHKARAITAWDYERLVLDRFPGIYKVKCITHTDPNCLCRSSNVSITKDSAAKPACCGPQIAPGHVLIIPIADLKHRNAVNPLQPKTSRLTLLEIQDYLSKRTSPFVKVYAKNPVYEQVLVFFRVQFIAGTDKGYYLKKLNGELVQYLTPWAFSDSAEPSFDQKIYASAIINFIEKRPYVDFITDFFMFVCLDECCTPDLDTDNDVDTETSTLANVLANISGCCDLENLVASGNFIGKVIAEPSTTRSILVSAPKHIIIPYDPPIQLSPCEQRKISAVKTTVPLTTQTGTKVAAAENILPTPEKSPVAAKKSKVQ